MGICAKIVLERYTIFSPSNKRPAEHHRAVAIRVDWRAGEAEKTACDKPSHPLGPEQSWDVFASHRRRDDAHLNVIAM
jgi:hypothetical protein